MKKALTILLLTSFTFATVGCNVRNQTATLLPQQSIVQSKSVKSDWYSGLKNDVKTYYQTAQGKTGETLFFELNKIISKGNKISSYGDSKGYMYAVVDNITINGATGIIDAYSQVFIPGKGSNGNSYKERGDQNGTTRPPHLQAVPAPTLWRPPGRAVLRQRHYLGQAVLATAPGIYFRRCP